MTAATRPSLIRYAEALAAVTAANLLLHALPFRRVVGWMRRRPGASADADLVEEVRRAVGAAARRVPFRALCFEQGLAAAWMLRRRGRDAQLFYGAATIGGELKAHVWVRSGGMDVIGCENASDYAILARFPDVP